MMAYLMCTNSRQYTLNTGASKGLLLLYVLLPFFLSCYRVQAAIQQTITIPMYTYIDNTKHYCAVWLHKEDCLSHHILHIVKAFAINNFVDKNS